MHAEIAAETVAGPPGAGIDEAIHLGGALAGDDAADAVEDDGTGAFDDLGGTSERRSAAAKSAEATISARIDPRSSRRAPLDQAERQWPLGGPFRRPTPTGRSGDSVRPNSRRARPVGRRVNRPSGRTSTTTTMISP